MDQMYNLVFYFAKIFKTKCFLCPGGGVPSPPGPPTPECGPSVGSVLFVSGSAAALHLEQTLHP